MSIKTLREEFLKEAKSAPKLFKDLAKVEQYIAESYKTRALIELMQNADDAESTRFGIHSFKNGFVVGNNGKEFTIDDVEALCRSGSSNKHRGGKTIGYRGIGFKSVVNIANIVNIISGEYRFSFERNKTKKALDRDLDVPLIRVPHTFNDFDFRLEQEVISIKKEFNYTTIFIFSDVIDEFSKEDLQSLDRSSLLFLKNLNEVIIEYKNTQRNIIVKHLKDKTRNIVKIIEGENRDKWEVQHLKNNRTDLVAFKLDQNNIIPALPEESVIHSFTPTNEFSGAYLKINGDYTTDPSRKSIDMDELSQKAFNNAVLIIVKSIKEILNGDLTKQGFFTPFINIQTLESSRFKNLLFRSIEKELNFEAANNNNGAKYFETLRIKQDWLNYEDYENICKNEFISISKNLIATYPEIFTFLKLVNVKTLNLQDVIQNINSTNLSIIGSAQIFTKIITQYRYDLDNNKIEQIKNLKLFPRNNKFFQSSQISDSAELDIDFTNYLNNNVDIADVQIFLKKLEINSKIKIGIRSVKDNNEKKPNRPIHNFSYNFKTTPAIKKWRSAENNAQEYLKSLNVALSVKDVTEANLGYDLEMMLNNGKRIYIEVKSVNSFSEPFKISNNEYSSAHNYGSDYYIALVVNNDEFKIKFVPNPIKTLSFEKKCERWSWFCDDYNNELQEISEILY